MNLGIGQEKVKSQKSKVKGKKFVFVFYLLPVNFLLKGFEF
jgi:hypothetical protein